MRSNLFGAASLWWRKRFGQAKLQNFEESREIIRASGLFDVEWYVQRYPDVAASGLDPLDHYTMHGGFEGRAGSPKFDSRFYSQHPDVTASGIHPMVHFVTRGARRSTRKPRSIEGVRTTHEDIQNAELLLSSSLFDADWYVREQALDLAPPEAALHYLKIGAPRGASPSLAFDGPAYLKAHVDVRRARTNPLLHYLQQGREEGRQFLPCINPDQSEGHKAGDGEPSHIAAPHMRPTLRITLVGNCQMFTVANCLAAMLPDVKVHYASPTPIKYGHKTVAESVGKPDILLIQDVVKGLMREEIISRGSQIVRLPKLEFGGFHPDLVHAYHDGSHVHSLGMSENSAIVLYCWINGLTVDETVALFRADVFKAMGYLDSWDRHVRLFNSRETDIDLSHLLRKDRCFMLSLSHPKLEFCAGVARAVCQHAGFVPVINQVENVLVDPYVGQAVMPVYPEVGAALGIPGEYAFKVGPELVRPNEVVGIYSLRDFVEAAFAGYDALDPQLISSPAFEDRQFLSIREFMRKAVELPSTPRTAAAYSEVFCDEELYDPQ